jgi:Cu/Ag efflux pump CusA
LLVTPALSLVLLGRASTGASELALLRFARDAYGRLLGVVARHAGLVIAGVVLLCAATVAVIPLFGGEFLPSFREGHFVLHASAVPGTSLEEMRRLGQRIASELLANPHIATVEQQIGRAELGEDPWGPHRSEFHVELKALPSEVEAGVEDEIRATLASFPGISYEVLTFLGDRIGETISGEAASVVVSIYGDELPQIEATAGAVERVLAGVRGAVDVQRAALPGAPRIEIHLDPQRMAQFGFRPVEVLEAVQTAYQGAAVAQTFEETKVRDVVVILAPEVRRDPERVGELRLRSVEGASVPLSQIADVVQSTGPFVLLHEGGQRRLTVTCNVAERDVASFVAEARERIARDVPPSGSTYIAFGGEAGAQREARNELMLHSALAGVGILLLLGIVFREPRNLMLVLINLPFALVGGVIAAYFAGGSLSIGSLIGFVTLFGITTRNSIMLVSHFEHLVSREGQPWNLATALRGARERFVPIAMTAMVTGLGLAPLAIESGKAGREIEGPMAAVILGGLVTSTLLNLLVLPTLALRFGRFGARERTV